MSVATLSMMRLPLHAHEAISNARLTDAADVTIENEGRDILDGHDDASGDDSISLSTSNKRGKAHAKKQKKQKATTTQSYFAIRLALMAELPTFQQRVREYHVAQKADSDPSYQQHVISRRQSTSVAFLIKDAAARGVCVVCNADSRCQSERFSHPRLPIHAICMCYLVRAWYSPDKIVLAALESLLKRPVCNECKDLLAVVHCDRHVSRGSLCAPRKGAQEKWVSAHLHCIPSTEWRLRLDDSQTFFAVCAECEAPSCPAEQWRKSRSIFTRVRDARRFIRRLLAPDGKAEDSDAEDDTSSSSSTADDTKADVKSATDSKGPSKKPAKGDADTKAEVDADVKGEVDADSKVPVKIDIDTKSETESGTGADTEAEPEAEADADAEPDAEADADAEPEAEADADAEPEAEADADAEPEAKADADADAEPEADVDAAAEPEAEADAAAEPEAEADTAAEPEAEADADALPEAEVDADADADAGPEVADADADSQKVDSDVTADGDEKKAVAGSTVDGEAAAFMKKLEARLEKCVNAKERERLLARELTRVKSLYATPARLHKAKPNSTKRKSPIAPSECSTNPEKDMAVTVATSDTSALVVNAPPTVVSTPAIAAAIAAVSKVETVTVAMDTTEQPPAAVSVSTLSNVEATHVLAAAAAPAPFAPKLQNVTDDTKNDVPPTVPVTTCDPSATAPQNDAEQAQSAGETGVEASRQVKRRRCVASRPSLSPPPVAARRRSPSADASRPVASDATRHSVRKAAPRVLYSPVAKRK